MVCKGVIRGYAHGVQVCAGERWKGKGDADQTNRRDGRGREMLIRPIGGILSTHAHSA